VGNRSVSGRSGIYLVPFLAQYFHANKKITGKSQLILVTL
jgi:hypothetical protein